MRPSPSAVRANSAAMMAVAALIPAPMSSTGAPTLTGPPASVPVTAMIPLAAWRIRSKPPRAASGPAWPNPEIEAYTRRGFRACSRSGPSPARSSDPGRAFSTNTSLRLGQRADQARSRPAARQVDGDAPLAGVQRGEQAAQAAHPDRALGPVGVAAGQPLHLDHVGAERVQHHRAVGAGHEAGQVQHPDPGQWFRRGRRHHGGGSRCSPNSARSTPVISPTVQPARAASRKAGMVLAPAVTASLTWASARAAARGVPPGQPAGQPGPLPARPRRSPPRTAAAGGPRRRR